MTDDRTTTGGAPGEDRLDALPDHERDDERTAGGGVLSQGGTAVDTGTGTLSDARDSSPAAGVDEAGVDVGDGEEPGTLDVPFVGNRS